MLPKGVNGTVGTAPDVLHQLTSSTTQVRQALEEVQAHLCKGQVDETLGDTAQIILAEVLNNIVEHAYNFTDGNPITLSITLRSNGLWCETFDEGLPMANGVPPNGVMPKIDPKSLSDLPEGGFGWAMVRELTQDIRYSRSGSVNHLTFLIPSPQG